MEILILFLMSMMTLSIWESRRKLRKYKSQIDSNLRTMRALRNENIKLKTQVEHSADEELADLLENEL